MRLDLVLGEEGDVVEEDKGDGAPEVNDFVHSEGHYPSREDVVGHVGVPRSPGTFEDVEMHIVVRDIVKVVGVGGRGEGEC